MRFSYFLKGRILGIDQHAAHERILLENFLDKWKKENIFDIKKPHFCFAMKQDLKITLDLIISSRLRYNLSRDLINFGLQIASSNHSGGVIQIISFPISISPTWTLTDNFKSLLTSFVSGRIQYLLRCTNNQAEGITYLK